MQLWVASLCLLLYNYLIFSCLSGISLCKYKQALGLIFYTFFCSLTFFTFHAELLHPFFPMHLHRALSYECNSTIYLTCHFLRASRFVPTIAITNSATMNNTLCLGFACIQGICITNSQK